MIHTLEKSRPVAEQKVDQWQRRKLDRSSDAASGTIFRISKCLQKNKQIFSLKDSLKFFYRLRACKETTDLILEAVKKY
jgi:hypothetical protein